MAALGISLGAKSTKRDMVLCRKCWQQGWTSFSFYMLKVKGGGWGETLKTLTVLQVWDCNLPRGIQTMQLPSYVLKLKSDLGGCLGSSVLLKIHTQADILTS